MSEFNHQVGLFTWAHIPAVQQQYPGIDLLEASLNGVKLTKAQAGKAKAAGMLKGAWDINLPVARGPYHGLRIEMKFGKNKLTDEQEWYGQRLREEGWKTAVCYSWTEAREVIVQYLQQLDLLAGDGVCRGGGGSINAPSP